MRTPLLFALILLMAGCTLRRGVEVVRLDVTRHGWDSLDVAIAFAERTLWGSARAVTPEAVQVHLFDSRYDTLATRQAAGRVPVPDADLGSRERLMLEACGRFAGAWVCEQHPLTASPKDVGARLRIDYPTDAAYERGRYGLRTGVRRPRADRTGWERLRRSRPLPAFLQVGVVGGQAAPLRLALPDTGGVFSLKALPGYRDYRYDLQNALYEADTARVRFVAFAELGAQPVPVDTVVALVRLKTRAEREAEVQHFARAAAEQVVDSLRGYWSDEVEAEVAAWRYNNLLGQYQIDLALRWGGGLFAPAASLEGRLLVRDDGTEPRFRLLRGSEAGVARWQRRFGREVVPLGTLPLPDTTAAPPPSF